VFIAWQRPIAGSKNKYQSTSQEMKKGKSEVHSAACTLGEASPGSSVESIIALAEASKAA
jgi:hypothetical protein